jgi:hypothetical protein
LQKAASEKRNSAWSSGRQGNERSLLRGLSYERRQVHSATPELLRLLSAAFSFLFPLLVLGEDLPHPVPVIDFAMPSEVDAPIDPDLNEIAVFDDYSWRAFIALNWPAKTGVRGLPDELKKIGDASDPGAKVVWGTWKADYELSEREGSLPTEWSSFDGFTPSRELPFEGSGRTMVLGSFFDFRDFNQAGNGRFGSPLVAQNHTYIRFEVRLNEVEFDFIRDQQLYRRSRLSRPGNAKLRFPNNSVAVKAAWKVIKEDELEAAQGKYYLVDAMVLDPVTNTCKLQKMGLVGLHIVQKTRTRPQWVWSSFEHIDNVPEPETMPVPGRRFSLNDPSRPQVLDPLKAPLPISENNLPSENPRPMQVIRAKKIADSTRKTNQDYQALLRGTVWANYQLVMTQWPKFPEPEEENGAPFPGQFTGPDPMTNIANTTMETYFQRSASTSCMNCHDAARRKGTDFVWFLQFGMSGQ